ncbi:MAG: hypothetical protein ABEJ95_05780 [Candidatus Nanohalobium sp.]
MSINIESENIPVKETDVDTSLPEFTEIEPDFSLEGIDRDFSTLIVIGNGGSITSLRALKYAFLEEMDRELEIITTMDPDRLHKISADHSPEDTLVMPISKSGSTVGVIESLIYFINRGYDFNPLTTPGSPLHTIAERYSRDIIEHQEVGGRFSGLTNTALAPAKLLGLETGEIREGGEEGYRHKEKAVKTAEKLYAAEKEGYGEVLTPFYSSRMFGFYPLLIQLMHETVCKEREGQTFYGDHAPEYQHHTNQRLFGGKENVLTFFFRTSHRRETVNVPEELEDINLKGERLGELDRENLSDALNAEYRGVRETLEEEKKPFIDLKLEDSGYRGFGRFMAFIQLTAYYSAKIRGVEPLTQPDVEKSKEKSVEERFK